MGKLELILSSRAATCISTKHSESAGQETIGKGVPHMPQHLVTSGLWQGACPPAHKGQGVRHSPLHSQHPPTHTGEGSGACSRASPRCFYDGFQAGGIVMQELLLVLPSHTSARGGSHSLVTLGISPAIRFEGTWGNPSSPSGCLAAQREHFLPLCICHKLKYS